MTAEHTPHSRSILQREQDWLAEQSVEELRKAIYFKLRSPIAADDLDGRKPFLALERLVEQCQVASEQERLVKEALEAEVDAKKVARRAHRAAEKRIVELKEQLDTAVAALEHIGNPNYSARPTGRDALDMAGAARDALRRIRGEET